jgi:peptidoglycan hydrolase-like protein with peptidoglycan-binding domain
MNYFDVCGNITPYSEPFSIFPTQLETQSMGQIRVRCTTVNTIPIENAIVIITYPEQPNDILEQLVTNNSGLTDLVFLPAPNIDYSLEPSTVRPYSIYDIRVSAAGYETAFFYNIEILADTIAEQNVTLNSLPAGETGAEESFVISPHTLYGDYPPKIPEAEIKPVTESGEVVLSQVVIPEFVIVHDGVPSSAATNYWVRFRDYIKNVACSEIYATWPESTIYANVLAILSFTLNRVYTEWYRNKGYDFTITSSTAYDHKWINGRNIYQNISFIVDSVFVNYLSFPNVKQPILTQYCDGNRVQCPNWMSQWGSKSLGDEGYSAIEILRNYYGSSMFINTATQVSGVPVSWKNVDLNIGSRGDSVKTIQEQLNKIATAYPAIPKLSVDGIYGPKTAASVKMFQSVFSLPETGVVDRATWYKISQIYVGVSRLIQ